MPIPIAIREATKARLGNRRVTTGVLALALASLFAGCGKSSANAPGGGPGAMRVQVRVAASAKIPETTEYLSILKSRHSAAINPLVEGQVTSAPS